MEHKKIGAAIILIDIETGDILLGRRGFDSSSPNTWAPFGGTLEPRDANPKTAAKREFQEETGYDGEFEISKEPFYINNSNNLIFYTYIGLIDGKIPVNVDGKEMLAYTWRPLDNLPDNLLSGVKEMFDNKKTELEELINSVTKKEIN